MLPMMTLGNSSTPYPVHAGVEKHTCPAPEFTLTLSLQMMWDLLHGWLGHGSSDIIMSWLTWVQLWASSHSHVTMMHALHFMLSFLSLLFCLLVLCHCNCLEVQIRYWGQFERDLESGNNNLWSITQLHIIKSWRILKQELTWMWLISLAALLVSLHQIQQCVWLEETCQTVPNFLTENFQTLCGL